MIKAKEDDAGRKVKHLEKKLRGEM